MENKAIQEFQAGAKVEGFYIIKSVDVKTTNSNNKKYMDFLFGDKTGEINGKLWECTPEIENLYSKNMVVKIRGTVLLWQNSLQFKVEKIRPAQEEDNLNPEEFVPVAPFEPEFMYNEILKYISKIQDKDIQNIIVWILERNRKKLLHYPAAKSNHHSIRSGLLYHITTMLKSGEALSGIYEFINKDLLFGGIILHDIAKIDEMDASELGIVSEYTMEGQLLGHIIQGIKMIHQASEEVKANKEVAILLEHMLLSHHYEPEYGSPKKPMIPEAELLHYIDMIDARMYDIRRAVENTNEGMFSEPIWSLDKRRIYKTLSSEKAKKDEEQV